ncbi:MAG: M20 family metallopeptidase [Bryobacteraceae bacterium]|nr:M20 family metallopeptidase [Bryobacterales bacterium]NUN00419.1 M20 family metallopeptidase [Bryobacteraceae bacterium]
MKKILSHVQGKQQETVALIRRLVECESPTDDAGAVNRFVDLLAAEVQGEAEIRTYPGGTFGRHLRLEFRLPGRCKTKQLLLLGHSDTVWPLGTLARMPFRERDGRLWGPGVLDMKSGIAFAVQAARALRELDIPVSRRVVLLLNADEEVGSDSSRPLTEREARRSAAVLVLEPGTGLEGKLKTARKGIGGFKILVAGRASHAGVDFAAGASAIVELAQQIAVIAGFTDLDRGITVNPGVIRGGSRSNVVADEASADVDFRFVRRNDGAGLERKFRSLRPIDKRCRLTVEGGVNRPPMERSRAGLELFRRARDLGKTIGMDIAESSTGGGSDGNFTAALGIPTLDGLGGVGEGAHALNESILTNRIADRTAMIAALLSAL